jgi:DNA-binding IclR family transcriptional regulator
VRPACNYYLTSCIVAIGIKIVLTNSVQNMDDPKAHSQMASESIAGAQVVGKAVQLLKLISQRRGWLIADLVMKSGLTRPTVYRLLSALQATALIEQDPMSKRWYLGPETYVLGTLASTRFNVERIAHEFVIRIADETGESAFLSIRRRAECICLVREEGTYPIRTHVLQAGDRLPLGVGSAGLAILAALEEAEIHATLEANRELISRRYPKYSMRLIKEHVAQTRKAGYAINRGLLLAGSWGIAAAVRDIGGMPYAALSITAIEDRLQGKRQAELGRLLVQEAARLTAQLRSSQSAPNSRKRIAFCCRVRQSVQFVGSGRAKGQG